MASLAIVGTPIGNLADISARALETLRAVDWIACEDTRQTRVLLDRYKIKTSTVSYHQHSSLQKVDWLMDQLKSGKDIALVSDAGTPAISDPGGIIVEKVHAYNREAREPIEIISIPGPSSVTTALSVCGFPADNFLFLGFLPKKKGRQSLLKALTQLDKALQTKTVVFFESAIRIHATLEDFVTAFAESPLTVEVCLARELSKKFEEIWRGSLDEAVVHTEPLQRGEFVVVISIRK